MKNLTEERQSLGAILRLPYEKLAVYTYAELAAHGFEDIRPAHSVVFRHILPTGSRLTELAERGQMTKQSMAYLVEHLHQHGYVDLMADPLDGRAKLVYLTERGVAFQEAATALSNRVEHRLGQHNMAQLRTLLEQVTTTTEALAAERNP